MKIPHFITLLFNFFNKYFNPRPAVPGITKMSDQTIPAYPADFQCNYAPGAKVEVPSPRGGTVQAEILNTTITHNGATADILLKDIDLALWGITLTPIPQQQVL